MNAIEMPTFRGSTPFFRLWTGPGSAPRNVQVRPLSSSTMVIQWDEPQEQNGLVTGYKVPKFSAMIT